MGLKEKVELICQRHCFEKNFASEDYILKTESLSRLTGFRTGGDAVVLFPSRASVIVSLLPDLVREKIPYFILGNGSNVIAKDEGYSGLLISLTRMKECSVCEEELTAEAGVSITGLASLAAKHSLTGMEFFYGIPGSVGGAVFMNAGAYGGECKDVLKCVTFVDQEGKVHTLPTQDLAMGYRTSLFESNQAVILSATFSLKKGNEAEIRQKMDELMRRRVEKQPLEYPSAGSTFKRYEGRFTAKMIEDAGLKGTRIGGAMVSEKHAGFLINYHEATSEDIFSLIEHVKQVIFQKEGIHIQCEVRVIE